MEGFWKAAALVLVTVILGAAVGKQEKDMALMLSAAACCIVGITAFSYLEEVISLVKKLGVSLDSSTPYLDILLQAAGVSILTELAGNLCGDAGSAALGKTMQLLGNAVILYLSVPVIEGFFGFLRGIIGVL